MTFIEALSTGKPMKRPLYVSYILYKDDGESFPDGFQATVKKRPAPFFVSEEGHRVTLYKSAYLATDWIVKE